MKEYKLMRDYDTLTKMINELPKTSEIKLFLWNAHDAIYNHIGKNNFEAEKLITEVKRILNNEGIR